MTALLRVARNVADLSKAEAFYRDALGFQTLAPARADPALAEILGAQAVDVLRMRLGAQEIELSQCTPAGAPYPAGALSNDLFFQHLALVSPDVAAAYVHIKRFAIEEISTGGPQRLPASAGGVTAFKFRDPEGHPLELLSSTEAAGYDHSAISVSNVERSVEFYENLGLRETARQVNRGGAQDRLDGLAEVSVDVVALSPAPARPHVELLRYRNPVGKNLVIAACDIAADRLVFSGPAGELSLLRDPNGHFVVLDCRN